MDGRAMAGRRLGVLVSGVFLILASACGGSDSTLEPIEVDEGPADETTTVAPTTTTTEPEPEPEEVAETPAEQTLAEADAEIEEAIVGWALFPTDTSKGEAGLPLEHLTGAMRDRYAAIGTTDEANGWVRTARGAERVEVVSLETDLDVGTADATICLLGDLEIRDKNTEEVLSTDSGIPGLALVFAKRTDEGWKLSEFVFVREEDEIVPCEFGAS